MKTRTIDIHTHRTTERATTLRTVGIHPWDAEGRCAAELEPVDGSVQAIGEIGLDLTRGAQRGEQMRLLREQLSLAARLKLPVVLHCVRAFEPLMRELELHPLRAVIFHGFIGSPEQARQAVARGYYLSFGMRTFASSKTVAALRTTPLEQIFCETDDCDVPIEEVYCRTAEARGVSLAELTAAIEESYKRIFETND